MRVRALVSASSVIALAISAPAIAQDAASPPAGTQEAPPAGTQEAPPAGTLEAPTSQDPNETTPTPVPAEPGVDESSESIVVTGIRSSLSSAQRIKQQSDAIVDALVADDIGKLPDITASASLARLPGVEVSRGAGEAASVRIRGLPDVSTTYNGREIFTSEGRFVQIQDFPAAQVAALEVFKSNTAERIEGGIGGQINVRGRMPFDFDGFRISGAVNGVHLEQSQDLMMNANLLISNRWDTGIGEIGVLVSGAYAETSFLDAAREAAQFVAARPNFATPEFRYPDSVAIFYGRGDRWRPSATAALQWRPSDTLEFSVDGLFQGYRGRDSNSFHNTPLFGAGATFSDIVLEPDSNRVDRFTVTGATSPRGFAESSDAETNTYQLGGRMVWTPERARLTADVAYTDSTFELLATNIDYFIGTTPTIDVDFDTDGKNGGPVFSWRDVDSTNPNNYFFRGLFDRNFRVSGKDIQARLDGEYETDFPLFSRLQAGIRYNDRDATFDNGQRFTDVTGDGRLFESLRIPLSSLPVDLVLTEPGFRFDDSQMQRIYVRPSRDSIRASDDALRQIVIGLNPSYGAEGPPPFNPREAFIANERTLASYGQFKYVFELGGGMVLDGLGGLRVVRTETTVNGTTRTDVPGGDPILTPVSDVNTQTEFLPNVSARLDFGGGLQMRAAFTETRTRPNFGQLNPSSLISPIGGDNYQNINTGNPNLRPLRSNNYDLSLEYYFSRTGSATFALFRRDVNGFISNVQVVVPTDPTDPSAGGQRFNRPENGGDGRLQGFEATFTTFLDVDFVPDWAKSFGVQANYTYNDATSELPGNNPPLPSDLSQTLPGQQRLAGVSKYTYNVAAFYEKPFFSARLAYNYRSDFVTTYRNPPQNLIPESGECCIEFDRPEIFEGRGVLDFSATVTPIESITFAFDVANILGNPEKITNPYNPAGDSFALRRRYLERLYSLGVRFRF